MGTLDGIAVSTHRSHAAPLRRGLAVGRLDLLAVAALSLGTLALGLYRSNSTSLWTDEVFSVALASKPLPIVLQQLWSLNANMGLYYLLLSAWLHGVQLLGFTHPSEWLIRVPSILFAVGAVLTAYFVGRRLFGVVVAAVGATLLLLNYIFLMEVAQARAYSLELFLQVIGWYLFIRILENAAKRDRLAVAFGAVMALALYAGLLSVLVIFAQLAAFVTLAISGSLSRERARDALRPAFIASLTLIVAVVPLALDVLLHGGANEWVPTPGLKEVLTFVGALAGANPVLALILIAGCALGLRIAVQRPEKIVANRLSPSAVVVLLAAWIAVPFVVSFGLSHRPFGLHLFLTRYLISIVPAICLLSAAGLNSISKSHQNIGRIALVASVLLAVSAVPEYYSRVQREDFRTASIWLVQNYQSGDGVACASLGCAFALEYYAPGKLQSGAPYSYVWRASEFRPLAVDPPALAAYAQTHGRLFYVYGTAGQSAYIGPDEQWLRDHNYRLLNRIETVPGSAGAVTAELWAQQ